MLKSKRTVIIKAGVNMYDGEGDSWSNERYNETPEDKNKLNREYGGYNVGVEVGRTKKKYKRSPYD